MYWIVWALVGLVVWWAVNMVMTGKAGGNNWWASLIVALLGSWLGDVLLGNWLWMWAGFNVIAGVIGAVVLTWLWNLVSKQLK
ncbi:GlsB/YeaQ/YmgE family stress response membrane protein [Brevibacillus brevis]|uniref:GlsB/YeaQ/YmgE family stress response membrane protein n=1 Tax=Brevibacillus brevis TaxID=1393 RepID=A0ABY9T6G1_BREBE|nr:GlsB/YeaQ/YmgE family stress response membrane protein [Brevibacillus brevis]WNC15684.1 GlsB/YeaQ/YmgE family stress response membrane protein [Brevibacillus brevis]